MAKIFAVTVRGIFRDRVLQGIMAIGVIFLFIPAVSSLSMRQMTELSITLSLSLISLMLLFIALFLGGTALWKDIERHYVFSVMGLPITRTSYVLGKFAGIAGFVLMTAALLACIALPVIWYSSTGYPPSRPILWSNILIAIFFDSMVYILLVGFAFLFSAVSTSFFLPLFGTVSVFLVGNAMQEVYDYIHSPASKDVPFFIKKVAMALYYVLPNFSAFDLKAHAIYSLSLPVSGMALTAGYFIVYLAILLYCACVLFSRRELQ